MSLEHRTQFFFLYPHLCSLSPASHPHTTLILLAKELIWALPQMEINGLHMEQTCKPSLQATYRILSSMKQDFPFSYGHSFK